MRRTETATGRHGPLGLCDTPACQPGSGHPANTDGSHCCYTYDADSKRVSQRTPEGYTEFIYQGPDMLKLQMERDEDGDTRVQYTMGAGVESMRRDAGSGMASGASSFYHYNHLGTTVALTNAAEAVSDTYRHDAWGVLLASTGSTVNPHTYVGQQRYYRMPTPGLYHLGFRDYGPRLGRFTTVDPARSEPNWFRYATNRPVVAADPLGLAVDCAQIRSFPWRRDIERGFLEFVPEARAGRCAPYQSLPSWKQWRLVSLVRCTVYVESGDNPWDVSANTDGSFDYGLCQIHYDDWHAQWKPVTGTCWDYGHDRGCTWCVPRHNLKFCAWLTCLTLNEQRAWDEPTRGMKTRWYGIGDWWEKFEACMACEGFRWDPPEFVWDPPTQVWP